jgi:hypothetical protein
VYPCQGFIFSILQYWNFGEFFQKIAKIVKFCTGKAKLSLMFPFFWSKKQQNLSKTIPYILIKLGRWKIPSLGN